MRILLLIIFLFVVNCKVNKIVDSHGAHYLEKKQKELKVNSSNKNDIVELLGPPSTKSEFDNDLWIYIERKKTRTTMLKFGQKKIFVNNVLVLDFDKYGILQRKEFYNKNQMNEIKFAKNKTENELRKENFIYSFLSSVRQKMMQKRK